ncbi:MAG: fatty acid CoA ligase family protein [Planctomycetota bacterium]|nr:fatty acid CoA ligase family protein [Planctomycetota bacterium]
MSTLAQTYTPTAGVARRLRQQAKDRPDQVAVWELDRQSWQPRTFQELDQLVDRTCHALTRQGIKRGMNTVLMVPPGREFLACTFALLRIGAPIVMIDPGMGIPGLGRCIARAAPKAFIGIPRAHRGRALMGWSRATIQHRISVGRGLIPPFTRRIEDLRKQVDHAIPFDEPVLDASETAAILFTSGSTGPAKGAVSHHSLIESQIDWIGRLHRIKPGEVDLPTFPLFGLFGVALGMTSIIPSIDFTRPAEANPVHLLDLLDRFNITSLFASPALLGNLARYMSENELQAPGLRRIVSAGAPARHDEIESLVAALSPEAIIETPYGATEAMPLCCIDHREFLETRTETLLGKGICLGSPVEGIKIRIVTIDHKPQPENVLAPGGAGEIWASGAVVTRTYYDDLESDQAHKYIDPQGVLWHRTGDLGTLDSLARIWFRGRRGQMVTTATGDLHTVAIERVFDLHPRVRRTALVGFGPSGQQKAVLCVELNETSGSDPIPLIEELKRLGSSVSGADQIEHFIFPGPFPVDIRHNAKINRESLSQFAARNLR